MLDKMLETEIKKLTKYHKIFMSLIGDKEGEELSVSFLKRNKKNLKQAYLDRNRLALYEYKRQFFNLAMDVVNMGEANFERLSKEVSEWEEHFQEVKVSMKQGANVSESANR